MPVNIADTLPAYQILKDENPRYLAEGLEATRNDAAVRVAILNLMPTKIATETQLVRLLAQSPLKVAITWLHTASHTARHTDTAHLDQHYVTFDAIKEQRFDGLIITGAPVELLDFTAVDYWPELTRILDWGDRHTRAILHLCWGAQAGLYHRYGIPKYPLQQKMFGIFEHTTLAPENPLTSGFDTTFLAPHSRHTEIRQGDLDPVEEVTVLATSAVAGIHLLASQDGRHLYVTGHPEYDPSTLAGEYYRDIAKGFDIQLPVNYFPGDDPQQAVPLRWRSHAALLFTNWLHYSVLRA